MVDSDPEPPQEWHQHHHFRFPFPLSVYSFNLSSLLFSLLEFPLPVVDDRDLFSIARCWGRIFWGRAWSLWCALFRVVTWCNAFRIARTCTCAQRGEHVDDVYTYIQTYTHTYIGSHMFLLNSGLAQACPELTVKFMIDGAWPIQSGGTKWVIPKWLSKLRHRMIVEHTARSYNYQIQDTRETVQ